MENLLFNIKLMKFYKKTGKIIYLILFSALIIETILQGIGKKHNFIIFIFIDVTFGLIGLFLESILINYSQLGTTYTETNKNITSYNLKEFQINNESFYIIETKDDYSFNIIGEIYRRNYKKDTITLKEDFNLQSPIVEITTIEKTAQAANNEYSFFASLGEKDKTQSIKIIVKDRTKDITNEDIDIHNK